MKNLPSCSPREKKPSSPKTFPRLRLPRPKNRSRNAADARVVDVAEAEAAGPEGPASRNLWKRSTRIPPRKLVKEKSKRGRPRKSQGMGRRSVVAVLAGDRVGEGMPPSPPKNKKHSASDNLPLTAV
jgi:hypothetical protein